MGYTLKLRILILLIAVLPPLTMVSILKFSTELKIELEQKKNIEKSTQKAENFILSEQGRVRYNVEQLVKTQSLLNLISSKKKPKEIPAILLRQYDLNIIAIVNKTGEIFLSTNNQMHAIKNINAMQNKHSLSKEFDQQGDHATFTYVVALDSTYYIFGGKYIDQSMSYLLGNIAQADVLIEFDKKIESNNQFKLEKTENGFQTVLLHSPKDKLAIILDFHLDNTKQLYDEVLQIISIVTISIMFLAIIVGIYFTGKTKKEIDNLRLAFSEVSNGNFDTTIMAYEKSEFSELADSFSEMVSQLKATQSKLRTVEKIAAWETVGRKLAHEIKNPLTPISIAADDLRSSYFEKLPDFDKTIEETTATIKKEVKRMNVLLDEFVSFARMKQSMLSQVDFILFISEIETMYAKEIASQKLQIESHVSKINILLDKDTFTQLITNLIKNGFESKDDAVVNLSISQVDNSLKISISDNGTGFSEAKLADSFKPFDTTKENGTGLGLVICHRIILEHNGSMELQNRKDGGGEVVITLPIV